MDLKKMIQIVEGGFNTQEINSAFDYDIVSSKDESVFCALLHLMNLKAVVKMKMFQLYLQLLRKRR